MSRVAGKYGKKPPVFPKQIGRLKDYLVADLPSPTGPFGYGLTDSFPMAENDTYGDCTIAGKVHADEVFASILNQPYTYPGDPAVLAGYAQLLGCTVEQLESDPAQYDTGLDLSTVITAWSSPSGFLGSQIVGAATIDLHDYALLEQAAYNFGCLYVGIECPETIDSQFESDGYWHLVAGSDPISGGHCVVINGAATVETSIGVEPDFHLITWGEEFAMTRNFFRQYGDEAWCVIPQSFVAANHDALASLNLTQMTADLNSLHAAK